MFLFNPRVVTCADNGKSEQVAVEPQTRVGIADGDGAMVYAEEQLVRRGMPLRLPLVRIHHRRNVGSGGGGHNI